MGLRNWLDRLRSFHRAPLRSDAGRTGDLARIEDELRRAPEGTAATARLYNRAGDLYISRGDPAEALRRYGRAIDTYMQAGEYDSAIAVCRKVLRLMPNVVRTRCTLAWLCIGKGFLEIAREQVGAYVAAARAAGQGVLAAQQLRLMSRYVGDRGFREFLADALESLGDLGAAEAVRRSAGEPGAPIGWNPVVFAALLSPEDLRRAAELGIELEPPRRDDVIDRYLIHPPE